MKKTLFVYVSIALFVSAVFALPVSASTTDGTIDTTYKYAWGENIGWVNFGTSNGAVHVTDSALSGYALSETVGWIYLGDVANNGEGALSGYAWGENVGWIKFNPSNGGVSINSSGEFTGSALGENIGWIIFDCSGSACVKTDWRPQSVRATPMPTSGGGGVVLIWPSATPVPTPSPTPPPPPLIPDIIKGIEKVIPNIGEKIMGIFKPKPKATPPPIPIEQLVARETPLSLRRQWELLGQKSVGAFVLAPLPADIAQLAEKFPALGRTFREVGITNIADIAKLRAANVSLPSLAESVGLVAESMPVASFTSQDKERVPSDIIFAKIGGGRVDVNATLSVSDTGEPTQQVRTIAGKPISLIVKPDVAVTRVRGYVVFTSRQAALEYQSRIAGIDGVPSFQTLALIGGGLETNTTPKPIVVAPTGSDTIEDRLILQSLEYTDPDGDGIFSATINAPVVDGEYEVITVLDYLVNGQIVNKELRMTTIVDPEGYVFEKNGDKETRIPGAVVSIYSLDAEAKKYSLWPAGDFQQENPQVTDKTGKYSFLVPPGTYSISVTAPGYATYEGSPFQVKGGSGIHANIELKPTGWLLHVVDWKIVLLTVVVMLLFYNFYRDRIRDRMLRKSKNP